MEGLVKGSFRLSLRGALRNSILDVSVVHLQKITKCPVRSHCTGSISIIHPLGGKAHLICIDNNEEVIREGHLRVGDPDGRLARMSPVR